MSSTVLMKWDCPKMKLIASGFSIFTAWICMHTSFDCGLFRFMIQQITTSYKHENLSIGFVACFDDHVVWGCAAGGSTEPCSFTNGNTPALSHGDADLHPNPRHDSWSR